MPVSLRLRKRAVSRLYRVFRCGLCLCAAGMALQAQAARFVIAAEDAELRRNILAHLSDSAPATFDTAQGRARLFSRVEQALQALGYYGASIEFRRRGEAAAKLGERLRGETSPDDVLIEVEPGERSRLRTVELSIQGEAASDPAFDRLLAESAPGPGDPLHHGNYSAFKRRLLSLGQARGYLDGRLLRNELRVDVAAQAADILIEYDSGKRYAFGEIRFDESLISPAVVAGVAPFAAGDAYEQAQLQQFRSRLQATGYFSSVVIQPQLEEVQGRTVPVQLDLLAAPRHSIELGVGYSTDLEERLSATWRSPRLNRWGHSQQTRLQYSPVNPSGQVIYRIPLGDGLSRNLQLRAGLENNEYGDVRSTVRDTGLLYERGRETWVRSLSLRSLRESWRVVGENQGSDYLLLGGSLAHRSRRGSVVDPQSGLTQFYSVDAGSASLGSDSDIWRLYAQLRGVRRLTAQYRIAGRIELGALLGNELPAAALPPSLAFFSGGDQTIRGFGYQAIGSDITVRRGSQRRENFTVGGTRLLVGSVELQRYLSDDWRVALFVDAGDAFEENRFELNTGIGVGLHYMSPIGALRLELANGRNETGDQWRMHINIGAEL